MPTSIRVASLWGPLAAAVLFAAGCGTDSQSLDDPDLELDPAPSARGEAEVQERLNCGGELSQQRVRLTWAGAIRDSEAVVPLHPTWTLEVQNTAPMALEIAVLGELQDGGAERRVELAHIALEGGETRRIAVEPAAHGADLGRGETAGHFALWAQVRNGRGSVVETTYAPGRWFHRTEDTLSLAVYDDAVRQQKYRRGDLLGRVADELRQNPNVRSVEYHDETARVARSSSGEKQ